MGGKILVGTASWSDIGFVGDWYPRKLPATERLQFFLTEEPAGAASKKIGEKEPAYA